MHLSIKTEAELTNEKIDNLTKMTKTANTVWLTHANWCGHCQQFQPEWKKFRKSNKGKNINVVDVESSAIEKIKQNPTLYKRITKKEGNEQVLYFPMIFVFYKKGDKTVKKLYEGERTAEKLQEFLKAKKVIASEKKSKEKKVIISAKKPKAKKGGNDIASPLRKKGGTENIQEVESHVKNIIDKFFNL